MILHDAIYDKKEFHLVFLLSRRKNLSANRTVKRDRASSMGAAQIEEVVKPTEEEIKEKELNLR